VVGVRGGEEEGEEGSGKATLAFEGSEGLSFFCEKRICEMRKRVCGNNQDKRRDRFA
jgi:hypothetical protein